MQPPRRRRMANAAVRKSGAAVSATRPFLDSGALRIRYAHMARRKDEVMPAALDAIDIKILDLMQRDASLSTGELAERVGLSQSPCWRRIQRLREEGYIKAVVAIVDHELVGFKMQIFAQVKMTTLTEEERANFYKAINSIPEILECWTVFGEMDAMMKILAPDVTWYQDFIFSVLLKLPGVVDVRSIVTLSAQKSTMAVPLTARKFR
jgi:Lrp/AsnC family transcriptional regulator